MSLIPHLIPGAADGAVAGGGAVTYDLAPSGSLYDVALGGIELLYASDQQNPTVRETAPYVKDRVDQATTPGEQTLSNWWMKSQDSFHGGAGQINLEPSLASDANIAHIRYDLSKNADVFTPGVVRRLPDTASVSVLSATQLVGVNVAAADALVVLAGGALTRLTALDTTPVATAFTGAASGVLSVATDGTKVYAATATQIVSLDPASPGTAAVLLANWPASVSRVKLGWVKSRLMAAGDNSIYEVDVSATGVTLGAGQLRLTHPQAAFTWRCFSDAPAALIAAGDANGVSEIAQFTINQVAGAPVLQVSNITSPIPVGERVLSMCNAMGTFQAIGTTRGVRIGSFDSFYGRLTFGPLELTPNDPVIPGNAVFCRDRFVYSVGYDYDEAGLLAVDLGTQVDQAGRYAWSPHLICPTMSLTAAAAGCVMPVSNRIAFAVPGTGVFVEQVGEGVARESWLRTSRIRYGTTEPKLFKVGTVRADLGNATVKVTGVTPAATSPLATVGFTESPPDFRLPDGRAEWLALRFDLTGTTTAFRAYGVKALPGTRKQRRIKLVVSLFDDERVRTGHASNNRLGARAKRDALESLDALADVVMLQEFTPAGEIRTPVVIEQVSFTQDTRPTKQSDVGGTATVIVRTVDA